MSPARGERAARSGRAAPRSPAAPVEVVIPAGSVSLLGILEIPAAAKGIVIFAHGSGSGCRSPRNAYVAERLHAAGFASLRIDLLTGSEQGDEEKAFDVGLLADRLRAAADWVRRSETTKNLLIGYFGASTGAAVALVAAAFDGAVRAIVSRGGRPDLVASVLASVRVPTLFIVGGEDRPVIRWNEEALASLRCEKALRLVPRATHLFEEPGSLDAVARLAIEWFDRHLSLPTGGTPREQ
jgi:putative phosphoribosyl transferase